MKKVSEELLEPHDAMLIVHPDCTLPLSERQKKEWFALLRHAQERCQTLCKPFIVSPMTSTATFQSIAEENGLNHDYHYVPSEDIVRTVASIVGKNARDVSLLIGGLLAERCVQNWAANLLETIEPTDVSHNRDAWMQNNQWWKQSVRFGKGRIDYSITDAATSE